MINNVEKTIIIMMMMINGENAISGGWDLMAVGDIWCHFFTPALSLPFLFIVIIIFL